MTRTMHRAMTLLVVAILVAGCGSPAVAPTAPAGATPSAVAPRDPDPDVGIAISAVARVSADPAQARLAAAAINDLGLDLLRAATAGENAVLSPASIVLALAMARAGALGETGTEMDAVLRDAASPAHGGWLNALDAALAARSGTFQDQNREDAEVALRIANAPFAQRDFRWEQPYLDSLGSRFGAGIRLVDYVGDPEAARSRINGWVREQTEARIPELLEPGSVSTLTRLALVNAIYLKAAWYRPFLVAASTAGPFTGADGSSTTATFVHGRQGVGFAEGDGWFAVDLPYVGQQLSLLMVVPDDLAAFEAGLDGAGLASIVEALEDNSVMLTMPRFGIETRLHLKEALVSLGMPAAFDPGRADFRGMTTDDRLFIAAVVHQANIDVDEAGTEASAATAVMMEVVSLPRQVRIDRPFLFALRDRATGAVLFLGRVVDPVER